MTLKRSKGHPGTLVVLEHRSQILKGNPLGDNVPERAARWPLEGGRKGQHSIRVNDPWRICFRWSEGHAHDAEIVDYHS